MDVVAYVPRPGGHRAQASGNRVERRYRPGGRTLYDRVWSVPLGAGLAATVTGLVSGTDRLIVAIGAGTEPIGARLAQAGHRVICVDPVPLPDATGTLLTVAGTLDALPLASARVDLVIATNVLHRHARPVAAAMRLADLLAPRGRLVCTWPRRASGPLAVASMERRTGAGWRTVSAHAAGRAALGALTGMRRPATGPASTGPAAAVRAAADAYGMSLSWLDLPEAAQTVAVADLPRHNWGRR